jgi:hypothetical protein
VALPGDGLFFAGEVFFFLLPVGLADFFFAAVFALCGEAFGVADALGDGLLCGLAVGVGVAEGCFFDFRFGDFFLPLGVGVGLTNSARRVRDGVSSLV